MKKNFFFFLFMCCSVAGFSQKNNVADLLIPQPVSVTSGTGTFVVNNKTGIHVSSNDASAKRVASFLSSKLAATTGYAMPVVNSKSAVSNSINLSLVNKTSLGSEGYDLKVTASGVSISANKPAGLFYGVQTLFQLLPKEIEGKADQQKMLNGMCLCARISDDPRFAWRGLMFDVSRAFFY